MTQAFPLHWPLGRPRASHRKRAPFNTKVNNGRYTETRYVSMANARDRLQSELDLLRAGNIVLSTNVELRLDGQPRSGQPTPADPGAALYFTLKGKPTVLACDRWDRVEDNIVAIAKHIEALRGMDRWGVGTLEQAFAGYQALPEPEQWWQVLGVKADASIDEIDAAWREKARKDHPDVGGSTAAMARLNAARDAGHAAVRMR